MKLLSWMHRKLQKDNTGSYKGSANGSSCLLLKPLSNNQEDYARQHNYSKERQQPQNHCQSQSCLEGFKSGTTEEINKEESTEIFPGFLTIGTLSVEPITEAATPTFDLPNQKENENGTPEMKYNLKLIIDELEKLLRAEAEKEGSNESSGRNSQASTETLTDKEKEEGVHKQVTTKPYPLQGYLLGSSAELLEEKQKDEYGKVSLQELFQSSRIAQRKSNKKTDKPYKQTKKESKSFTHLMNKMLQSPQPSSKGSTASKKGAAELPPKVKKLDKIKRLFNKKVHPETNTDAKNPNKFSNYEPTAIIKNSGHKSPDSARSSKNNRMSCWGTLMKEENWSSMNDKKLSRDTATKNIITIPPKAKNCIAGWEHWINTDADYLVLELQQNEVDHNQKPFMS